jgi:hypothetical protein
MIATGQALASAIGLIFATTPADWQFLHGSRPMPEPGFWSSQAALWAVLLTGVGAAMLAWVIVAAVRRDRARHGPTVRYLARALGLSAGQRRLLERVARATGLPSAGSLLISRGCFDKAVHRYIGGRGRSAQLAAVRRRIFDH